MKACGRAIIEQLFRSPDQTASCPPTYYTLNITEGARSSSGHVQSNSESSTRTTVAPGMWHCLMVLATSSRHDSMFIPAVRPQFDLPRSGRRQRDETRPESELASNRQALQATVHPPMGIDATEKCVAARACATAGSRQPLS
jgi:hypothetical protein